MSALFEQLLQAQIWPKCKNFCVHQKANDQMTSENIQKVHSWHKLWGFKKSSETVTKWGVPRTLFKWPPWTEIVIKSYNFKSHQMKNYLKIILGSEIFDTINHPV